MVTGTRRGAEGPTSTFAALMVGTLGYPLAPARGVIIDVCHIDSGCSRISISILPGARRQYFIALMVGALGSPAPAHPRGLAIDVF
jgi:hypothetical protein